MKKTFYAFLIISILIVSGCTSQDKISSDSVNQIKNESLNQNITIYTLGGVQAQIKLGSSSESVLSETIDVLRKRADIFWPTERFLNYSRVNITSNRIGDAWTIQLEVIGGNETQLKSLIETPGKFESRISKVISLENAKGIFIMNDISYEVSHGDGVITLMSGTTQKTINEGRVFELDGIKFKYSALNDTAILFSGIIYEGNDITYVFTDAQHAIIMPYGANWEYRFSINITDDSANRFAKITKNLNEKQSISKRDKYLESNVDMFLDNVLIDSLSISSDLRGKALNQLLVAGIEKTKEDASYKIKIVQTVLKSGVIPTPLEIIQIKTIPPAPKNGSTVTPNIQ